MSHCHEHDHNHHCGCSCSCCRSHQHEEQSCCEGKDGHEDFASHLLSLADEAWMELLKDKIKENILSSSGAQLDQLAKTVAESNGARWKNKLAMKHNACDFKDKIRQLFSCDSGNCKK